MENKCTPVSKKGRKKEGGKEVKKEGRCGEGGAIMDNGIYWLILKV